MADSAFWENGQKGLDFLASPSINGHGGAAGAPEKDISEMRLLSLSQVREILNLGKYSLAKLIDSNRLRTIKIGHRRLVSLRALREYLDELDSNARKEGNYGQKKIKW